uniref:Uncharacterized protein n=1 Tax=Spumella elongata TaxID=89044 RepID=A0A7S3HHS8_9STRA|mmetsp:Transcript_52596/g.91815  ORF Transcript_52596/g.91815 Transcript_52596/m.91815 type:complete len:195 (+) Transcript_52596:48-632(+)
MFINALIVSVVTLWLQVVSSVDIDIAGVDETDFAFVKESGGLNSTLTGTNTYAGAINYARTHPTRDGGTWAGWCASLMVRAGNLPSPCPSAIECYRKSTIISHDVASAPSGAFHWWDVGEDGHVAMATDHGWAMMASCRVTESWGDCIGNTDVTTYTANTGARYLGWSYDYDGSEISGVRSSGPAPKHVPVVPK